MILGIDTATRRLSIALLDENEVLAEHHWLTANHHSKELSAAIGRMLEQATLTPPQLTAVGVAIGPGSFTGVRIGMAVAKGLAMALDIPLIGIMTTDIVAAATPADEIPLVAIVQAGRGRIIAGRYRWQSDAWLVEGTPILTTWPALLETIYEPTLLNGEIDQQGRQYVQGHTPKLRLLPPEARLRRASTLARLTRSQLRSDNIPSPALVVPIYLK